MSRAARRAAPFSARAALAVILAGAGALLLFLYASGAGWNGDDHASGSGHAEGKGLNGYSALVELLKKRGETVSTSRTGGALDDEALLIITPQHFTDTDALGALLTARRLQGPTIVILPKWFAFDLSQMQGVPRDKAKPGWVMLGDAIKADWIGEVEGFAKTDVSLGDDGRWQGLERSGKLPSARTQTIFGPAIVPLVRDGRGSGALVAYRDDTGSYVTLAPLAGLEPAELGDDDENPWAQIIVAEPDLFNNAGMADEKRAELAVDLIVAAKEGEDLPIVFDLTLAGLSGGRNLLTLAFEPPFLAATLCLILLAALIAWRSFRRFGPPLADVPALAQGKRQLAINGAALVERARRLSLLGAPYAAMVAGRIAARLGVRETGETRDIAVARLLAARGIAEDYPNRLSALREARSAKELLRAAGALKSIERTLEA